ncbi:ATP-dependent nuclease [Fundidesulfovibrio terrae]|uniref:ATP-dependent nuclease n=1 Tax=Fundidesulfovibrio terrae TaxID=2922866 RepID=UPI001FAFA6FC|nr:ATP-binding protein [Fundidesulfovibrio terrae]
MHDIIGTSYQIKNYKCIGNNPTGFSSIQAINIIIGKNNSGKSSLLDTIGLITNITHGIAPDKLRGDQNPTIIYNKQLEEHELRQVFRESTSGGEIRGYINHWNYGKQYIGKKITLEIECITGKRGTLSIDDCDLITPAMDDFRAGYKENLAQNITNKYANKLIIKIDAERDIVAEQNTDRLDIQSSGHGITNIVQNYIVNAELNNDIIHGKLLNDLNSICNPEIYFEKIECKRHQNGTWEIFLTELNKGSIRLSNMGSGIKTIIHVLVATSLSRLVYKKAHENFIYCIEEPENNLHPSMLRRLLKFITKHTEHNKSCFFITTHSATVIDFFSKTPRSAIYHSNHDNGQTTIKQSLSYEHHKKILDDLEIRASDLLQSNGIIWVEGPSDRNYLKNWINIWSDGMLQEGMHYQIVFYGGRLLSHLHSNPYDHKLISMLNVNRNNAILIDSDKRNKHSPINHTKKRIRDEIINLGGHCWITFGKEIENYITSRLVTSILEQRKTVRVVGRFEDFFSYLDEIKPRSGTFFKANKPKLSEMVSEISTKDDITQCHDLPKQLDTICNLIKRWNTI